MSSSGNNPGDKSFVTADLNTISEIVMNNSRSMLSVINRQYRYERVNDTFCKAHLGLSEKIVGKSLEDVWGKDIFNQHIKARIDKCFNGTLVKYEASFNLPRSGLRFFEVIFRPVSSNDGKISHLLAETFDVTDLRLSEKNLIEKEEEFRQFETNLPIGFVRCRPDGTIMHANKAFHLIMASGGDKLLCRASIRDLYAEPFLFDLHYSQLNEYNFRSLGRVGFLNCRKERITCRVSAFLVKDDNGSPLYIDYSVEDSSREVMLEQRLLEAYKLETIGSLAGGIAHDFNNILATISGYAELLIEDLPPDSPVSDVGNKINHAIAKAQLLINQILTFSKQVEQDKVPVNVYEVLKETVGFVRSVSPDNVSIKGRYKTRMAKVLADPTQLFRVFLNLLTNAIQAIENDEGTIQVALEMANTGSIIKELGKDLPEDKYIRIVFRDSGRGMDAPLLRRIFEPFFTTREVGKGSGLGLSVVHGIVSELGGEISVESQQGKGSRFVLYLPLLSKKAGEGNEKERRQRILFIPGNVFESKILFYALESKGYVVNQCPGNEQLYQALSDPSKYPDLVIYMSDNELIDIKEITIKLKLHSLNVPCIILTDNINDIKKDFFVNSGLNCQLLIKPVSLKEIKDAIDLSIG